MRLRNTLLRDGGGGEGGVENEETGPPSHSLTRKRLKLQLRY